MNQVNRYFRFDDSDSYLRVYGRHTDNLHSPISRNEFKNDHSFYMRYDSISLLRHMLKSSVDVDLQNLLNSYLVSQVALTARQYTGHEVGSRNGLRQGLVVNEADSYYDRGPIDMTFETFVEGFTSFYNNSDDPYTVGTFENFSMKNMAIHRPPFSFGSYKGADNPKAKKKAYRALVQYYSKFQELFESLVMSDQQNQSRRNHYDDRQDSHHFKVHVVSLQGTMNTTAYRSGGSTQTLAQQNPIRDKDGLYAIIMLPRDRNLSEARKIRGCHYQTDGANYDPVYSHLFNAYADCPKLGDSFLKLSSCIVIKLNNFFCKSSYRYASDFHTATTSSGVGDFQGGPFNRSNAPARHYGSTDTATLVDYQTFGPMSHMVMPESCYDDTHELHKKSKLGLLDDCSNADAKQEFLSLEEETPFVMSGERSFFGGSSSYAYLDGSRGGYRSPHWNSYHTRNEEQGFADGVKVQNNLAKIYSGHRDVSSTSRDFYCWMANSETRAYKPFGPDHDSDYVKALGAAVNNPQSPTEKAHEEGDYYFGSGSFQSEPISEADMFGTITALHKGGYAKHKDLLTFYTNNSLNSDKLFLKNSQTILCNFKITNDESKRGKGEVYVDQDNIAHCPLSGEALRVRTYLRNSNRNSPSPVYGEPCPSSVVIS